jgi:predicted nucleic acid-binding protein
LRIYLNSSAWNRPFDDLTRPRVRHEAEAVAAILELVSAGRADLLGSEYLDFEVDQNPDPERAARIRALLAHAANHVRLSATTVARAKELEKVGLRGLDALHVAAAEAGGARILITTDDRMLKRVGRLRPPSPVRAMRPGEALELLSKEGEP